MRDLRVARFPVTEVFGPTVQGEGPDAGRVVCFVRLGGCDYRCSWCDSMYAVEPAEVRKAERLTAEEIMGRLSALYAPKGGYAVLSGGNPALHHLLPLMHLLGAAKWTVSIETQGSVWRDWVGLCDRIVISPKPPSSGMATGQHAKQTERFMEAMYKRRCWTRAVVKIVAFDEDDLDWAGAFASKHPKLPFFLSAGTTQGLDSEPTKDAVLERYHWLCERVLARRGELAHAVVLPQLHVLAWGVARGH